MKYIYHHLGLGDHIICNGLVRSLIKPNEKYKMFVKPHNLTSVKFMYRDLKNLDFITGDDDFAKKYLKENNVKNENLISAGFYRHPLSKEFDDSFYLQNNLPFINRWDKFYVKRDLESEKKIFNTFNIEEGKYIFVHDDKSRGYEIDESYIKNKNLKIVRPKIGLTENIFDYCYVMIKSLERHFIDSSFRLIYDSIATQNESNFFHVNYKKVIRNTTTKSQSKLYFNIL